MCVLANNPSVHRGRVKEVIRQVKQLSVGHFQKVTSKFALVLLADDFPGSVINGAPCLIFYIPSTFHIPLSLIFFESAKTFNNRVS